jgi:hypothetical protein
MKFNIGDYVRVDHPNCGTWTGKIYRRALPFELLEAEYWVTGAPEIVRGIPILAWESEITKLEDQ